LAQKPSGRRRADVEIKVLDQLEIRNRRSVRETEQRRVQRTIRRAERKAARIAEREMKKAQKQVVVAPVVDETGEVIIVTSQISKHQRLKPLRTFLTMLISLGIFTTVALPAYAFSPDIAAMQITTTDAAAVAAGAETQNLTVAAVNLEKYARSSHGSISAQQVARAALLNRIRTDTSKSVETLLMNPPYTKLDPVEIMNVAAKFEGVPYVFGGDSPAAFDCSGYVAYVFAHFGVALPHSVVGDNYVGKRIRPEHARPGDLVVFNDLSHEGIYAGNGNFWHAPRPGDHVKLAPIYSSAIHFVRIYKNN